MKKGLFLGRQDKCIKIKKNCSMRGGEGGETLVSGTGRNERSRGMGGGEKEALEAEEIFGI